MKICDASNPLVQICLSVHSISLLGEPELHQNHQSVKVNVNPPPLHTIRIMKIIWKYLKTFLVQENFPLDKFRTKLKVNLTVSSLQYVAFYAPLCCTATVLHHIYAIIGSTLILRGNNTLLQKRKGGCLHFRIIFIHTITFRSKCAEKRLKSTLVHRERFHLFSCHLLFLLFTGQSASALPRSLFPTRISQFSRIYPTSSQRANTLFSRILLHRPTPLPHLWIHCVMIVTNHDSFPFVEY